MTRILVLAASLTLAAAPAAAAVEQSLSLGSDRPLASIVAQAGIGSRDAWASAHVRSEDATAFCATTAPENVDTCVADLMAAESGRLYTVTANCETRTLTTHNRRVLTLAADSDQIWKDSAADSVGPDATLSQHWGILCAPQNAEYTAALDQQAAKAQAEREAEIAMMLGALGMHRIEEEPAAEPAVEQVAVAAAPVPEAPVVEESPANWREAIIAGIDHNGSLMWHDAAQGVLYYDRPKASLDGLVERGTVLFQGAPWSFEGEFSMSGTAYTFRKGCAPAPYHVEGGLVPGADPSMPDRIVLRGASPKREQGGCAVVGYTHDSPNAELVFQLNYGDV
ncbi:hypothetical protein [Devosia sediminis]|uniref:DUF4893 domain-containing protein n=1 Tax=Devosia sediminis TaxID=2798801 RepID=A0A934MRI3_9HYPH|nr:hypothetical protein [Devosia sediminis]MBJ3785449.1 hypothetical protein [Devosia sediminis]